MPLDSTSIKLTMLRNAGTITTLKNAIDKSVKIRDNGIIEFKEWKDACSEFHQKFDELAFPGRYSTIRWRIESHDKDIGEYLLCFLECRPYFFRSGYMRSEFLRKIKRLNLTTEQDIRLQNVHECIAHWKARKANPPAAEPVA